jgi:hypothetical protein
MNRAILFVVMLMLSVGLSACVAQQVSPPPIAPASLEEYLMVIAPQEPVIGQIVSFQVTTGDGGLSFDPSIVFHWDFGDHGWLEGSRVEHVYQVASEYLIQLTTIYKDGRSQTQQVSLNVRVDTGGPKTPVPPTEPTPTPIPSPPDLPEDKCTDVVIDSVLPNPSGTEPKEEWIRVKNLCDDVVNLKGWHLADENGAWTFPTVNLEPEETIRIFGSDYNPEGAIKNIFLRNNGETIRLLYREYQLIHQCEYPDTESQEDIVYLCG